MTPFLFISILISFQILRGLLARNHPDGIQGIERLFTVFDDPQVSWDAARGIGELAKGGQDILVKDNFCVIRVSAVVTLSM